MDFSDGKLLSPVLSSIKKKGHDQADVDALSFNSGTDANGRGDEALKLVGRERTHTFSDEYNAKLRRKLVRSFTPKRA